jgi:hypothetical protein
VKEIGSFILAFSENVPNLSQEAIIKVLDAWNALQKKLLTGVNLNVENASSGANEAYRISADITPLLNTLQEAATYQDGFLRFRQLQRSEKERAVLSIPFTLLAQHKCNKGYQAHHALTVLIQQIYLAMNLAAPGSAHFPLIRFNGKDSENFAIPALHASPFIHAYWCAHEDRWPPVSTLQLDSVWSWLETLSLSASNTAILSTSKVLFGLLDTAQNGNPFGLKEVQMIWHMLALLTQSHTQADATITRRRIAALFGQTANENDSLAALYRIRNDFVQGNYPTRRPALMCHDADDEIIEQLKAHNTPAEEGLSVVIAMLQKLISNQASAFSFHETVGFERGAHGQ